MKNMKRLLLLLAVIQTVAFCATGLYAQKLKPTEVPDDVVQTLDMQYSYAKVMNWLKDGNQYIADFHYQIGSNGSFVVITTADGSTFTIPIKQ